MTIPSNERSTENTMHLQSGTVVNGRYRLGDVLGQGGFGITYLGWDLTLNRKLAVKEFFPSQICGRGRDSLTVLPLAEQNEAFEYGLKKFMEEAQALARFHDHPCIVSLLDFFNANGTAYIVMPYVEGLTFEQYLKEKGGKIPFDIALKILMPVMDALREMHGVGLLHRDISPANIYINEKRQVKILDFGSARQAMRDRTQNLTVLFKPGYAPLEQYSTGGRQGPWTDVYAVAATLYRAITGQPPTDAPDRPSHDTLQAPSCVGVSIPAESEAAIINGLTLRPEDRFQTIREFQDAVASGSKAASAPVNSESAQSRTPQRLPIGEKNFSPKPLGRAVIAGVSTAVLVLVAAAVLYSLRHVPHPKFVLQHKLAASPGLSVAFSPDGRWLASGGTAGSVSTWDVATAAQVCTITGHNRAVTSVAFSPDGRWLASGSLDRTIKLWDATTCGQLRALSGTLDKGIVNSVAFSPDGRWLASAIDNRYRAVSLWNTATWTELQTLTGQWAPPTVVAFSPDSRWLASASGLGDQTIKLWDVASRSEVRSFGAKSYGVGSLAFSPDGRWLASGNNDHTITMWDVATAVPLWTITGHNEGVTSVAFSADGRWLASGSSDRTIKLWDATTGGELDTLIADNYGVTSLAFSLDGRWLASGSQNAVVSLWKRVD